jgi:hypothetical protein
LVELKFSWLVTGTSIKSGGVKLVAWVYTETSNINLILVKAYTLHYSIETWQKVLDATLCDTFVSNLRQVGGFLQSLPPIKLTATI